MGEAPLRVIHVGVGRRGVWPLEVVAGADGWRSVALVDVAEPLLAAARERTGLTEGQCFASLTEAAAAVEADVAVICTPTQTHAELSRQGFTAGLHVLVEKGMTTDLATARALVSEADSAGVRFCVSQNYRYTEVHQALRDALQSGNYGEPAFFDHIHHRRRVEPLTLNYPAAVLWDMACHHLDNFVCWFGPIKAVNGRLFTSPWSKYDYDAGGYGWLEFESGLLGNYELTHIGQANRQSLDIHTTAGTLRLYDVAGLRFQPSGTSEDEELPVPEHHRSERLVLDAFGRYIEEGVEPGISGRENLKVLETIAALIASHEAGGARVMLSEV